MKNRILVLLVGLFASAAAFFAFSAPASAIPGSDAMAALSANGITWTSSGGCTAQDNPTCTSFEGIQQSTVDGIITLKNASGCDINISGGTEVGHAGGDYSHGTGYKLDIWHGCIDGYITGAFTRIGNRSGDNAPQWQAGSGNLYADEGSHWDIVFYTCGC